VGGSMTRTTSTRARLSNEQIKLVINTIEVVCKMLLALIPILKGWLGQELPPDAK